MALLAWADRHNTAIIEDDYDSEFRFGGRPIEPLRMLDTTGRVIYVGSFSKTLLPTLRLGFIVVPPSLREAVRKAKFVADWHTSTTIQAALAHFIDGGGFARHIRKVRDVYRARHQMIADTLRRDFADHLEVVPSTVGLHIAAVARTASADQIAVVVRRASDSGVVVQDLSRFGVRWRHHRTRIGTAWLCATWSHRDRAPGKPERQDVFGFGHGALPLVR